MSSGTGSQKANMYAKKLLPLDMVKDCFLDYCVDKAEDLYARFFTSDGSFDVLTPVVPTGGNDEVQIVAAFAGTDGQGHTIKSAAANPLYASILFENSLGTDYHIGIRYNLVPAVATEINTRTGAVEYVKYEESVGNVDDPNSVTDLGATIKLIVDSITESGVSHVGRTVRVWLKTPLIDDPLVAFEDRPVQWDGVNNYITTTGLLGQSVGSVSVVAADYTVQELGVTLQQLASGDLRTDPGVLFLAKITGTGPAAALLPGDIDTTDQKIIAWTVTGWLDVTRVDVHGDTKIRVTADPLDVNEPQIDILDAIGTTVFTVDETGNPIVGAAPANTPTKSSLVGYGDDVYTQDDTICGGISELQEVGDHSSSPSVLWGLTPSFGGSIVNLTSGAAYYYTNPLTYGWRYGKTYRTAVPVAYDFVGKPASTYILSLDNNGTFADFDVAVLLNGGLEDGRVPIAVVNFDGVNVTSILDIRFICNTSNRSTVVTVGSNKAARSRAHNFYSLKSAIVWWTGVYSFLGASGGIYPFVEIVVNDTVTETETSTITTPGVTIRATSKADACRVAWDFINSPLIDVQADRITIRDVAFEYLGTNVGSVSDDCVVVNGVRSDFRFVNNRVRAAGAEGLHYAVRATGGSLARSLIAENRIEFVTSHSLGVVQHPINIGQPISTSVIRDNSIVGPGLPSTVGFGIYFANAVQTTSVRNNSISYVEDCAIYAPNGSAFCAVVGNTIANVTNRAIQFTGGGTNNEVSGNNIYNTDIAGVGGTIDVDTTQSRISQNIIQQCPHVAAVANEILAVGADCVVSGNVLDNVQAGIQVDGSNSVCNNNRVSANNGSAIVVSGTAVTITGNTIDHWGTLGTMVGVDISGPWCVVDANVLNADTSGGTYGIRVQGAAVGTTVVGNTIQINHSIPAVGAFGVIIDAANITVTGNTFRVIGDAVTGGVGVYVTALGDGAVIAGNGFGTVYGSAVFVTSGATDCAITGNACGAAGLLAVVVPIVGVVLLDMIYFAGQDGVINSNTCGTLVAGGFTINLTATSTTSIAQLNHMRAGGAGPIVDAGAGNLIAGGGNL